jgi:hypothetical protein
MFRIIRSIIREYYSVLNLNYIKRFICGYCVQDRCLAACAARQVPLSVSFRHYSIFILVSTPLDPEAQTDDAWEPWNKAMLFQISESVGQSDASALFLSVFEKLNVLYGKHYLLWFLCSRQCSGYLWAVQGTQSVRAELLCRYGWRDIPGIWTAGSC